MGRRHASINNFQEKLGIEYNEDFLNNLQVLKCVEYIYTILVLN